IDPVTPATLYAGTSSLAVKGAVPHRQPAQIPGAQLRNGDGVFKSTDGGANWSLLNEGLTNTNVSALVIDPATPTTIYAGTLSGVFDLQQARGPRMFLSLISRNHR